MSSRFASMIAILSLGNALPETYRLTFDKPAMA
jgi:hypothetical protein